ncbi:MAG TPA: response regulator [Chloroflexota bacterium]|nr:response regulator [Chloroflexota bacterium]
MSDAPSKVLAVDDQATNLRLLDAVLSPLGYTVVTAANGQEALDKLEAEQPDLILTDIMMPVMDGYELCRRVRQNEATRFLPIITVTGTAEAERLKALLAGADDFVRKPFDRAELRARVKSLLRVKEYHDRVEAQAKEMADLNLALAAKVQEQMTELERLNQLRRFLPPQLLEEVAKPGGEALLESHRRQIAVVFTDLRGFTSFAETAEPEEVMHALRDYHQVLGPLVQRHNGTVGFFSGDGLMIFFNDPIPCDDPATQAVLMAASMRDQMAPLTASWSQRRIDLSFSAAIAFGYATLGRVGFAGRSDYTAIGSVVNQAARLCGEAGGGEVLVDQRVLAAVEGVADIEPAGEFRLKGFARPVPGYKLLGVRKQ